MRGSGGRGGPMGQMGVGGGLTWGEGVEEALKGLEGKDGEVVGLVSSLRRAFRRYGPKLLVLGTAFLSSS